MLEDGSAHCRGDRTLIYQNMEASMEGMGASLEGMEASMEAFMEDVEAWKLL